MTVKTDLSKFSDNPSLFVLGVLCGKSQSCRRYELLYVSRAVNDHPPSRPPPHWRSVIRPSCRFKRRWCGRRVASFPLRTSRLQDGLWSAWTASFLPVSTGDWSATAKSGRIRGTNVHLPERYSGSLQLQEAFVWRRSLPVSGLHVGQLGLMRRSAVLITGWFNEQRLQDPSVVSWLRWWHTCSPHAVGDRRQNDPWRTERIVSAPSRIYLASGSKFWRQPPPVWRSLLNTDSHTYVRWLRISRQ